MFSCPTPSSCEPAMLSTWCPHRHSWLYNSVLLSSSKFNVFSFCVHALHIMFPFVLRLLWLWVRGMILQNLHNTTIASCYKYNVCAKKLFRLPNKSCNRCTGIEHMILLHVVTTSCYWTNRLYTSCHNYCFSHIET